MKIASKWSQSFDVTLDAYNQLAQNIPPVGQYRHTFEQNPHMLKVLALIFDEILQFHLKVLMILNTSGILQCLRNYS